MIAVPVDLGVRLSRLDPLALEASLRRCCAAERWVREMADRVPFEDEEAVLRAADEIWWGLAPQDWREAWAAHPRIGARDLDDRWSRTEQSGVAGASEETLRALERANAAYEARFGFIFLICATGLGADEMLAALRQRLENAPERELRVAAKEQAAITRTRLLRLAAEG